MNSFRGLGLRGCPKLLVPCPGVMRVGGSGPECESPVEEAGPEPGGLWMGWFVYEGHAPR